jgi:anaerobic ribonucleoside-triphosphate reductase
MDHYTIIACKHCKDESTLSKDTDGFVCNNCGAHLSTAEVQKCLRNIGAIGNSRGYADERGQGSDYYSEVMFGK